MSFFSAIVDEFDTVHEGGYGAPLRDALGVTVEEFLPLRENATASVAFRGAELAADVWQEHLALAGADVMGTYLEGPGAGMPAITRNRHGAGVGWYVSTRLDASGLAQVMKSVYADAGITAADLPAGVEVIRRRGEAHDYVTVINHGDTVASVPVSGFDLVGQNEVTTTTSLAGGAVAVIRTPV